MDKTKFIESVYPEDTGGGTIVDIIQLKDGRILGISEECVVLYPSMDAFYDGVDGVFDFPAISL